MLYISKQNMETLNMKHIFLENNWIQNIKKRT